MDQSLRLRLVVRRHGLPEARVLFNVPLDDDPTVAQLVELVNESIPLESDDWGLDDYTVELHAKDGHAFECLHFQPVASILEKDDEVFIRPLLTNDLKKRRIGGRDQISSGGQHLIDGVPFGRPRLRAPRGRPAVHIAPRKRRRLTYDGDFDQDDLDDIDDDDQGDGGLADQYLVSGHHHDDEDEEGDEPLLLTQHGEPKTRKDNRRVHFPRSVTATAEFEDTDSSHGESSEHEEDTEAEDDQDEDMFEPDSEDLREELSGLAEEAADTRRREIVRDAAEERPLVSAEVNDFGPFTEEDSEPETSKQGKRPNIGSRNRSSHDVSDKVIAVRSAFPAVSGDTCEELLVKHNYDVGSVWKKLAQQLKPRLDLAQTMVLNTQLELPKEVMVISSPARSAAEAPGEVSRIGDEDEDATDGPSSADEDEDENEEEEGEEPEGHPTSSESEYDEDSDSDSDASAENAPAPRTAPDAKYAGSSSSSNDEIGSNDDDKNEAEDRAANPGNRAKGGRQASNYGKQSTSLRSRRRRNVIESSPASSHATNTKSTAGPDNTTVLDRVASPSDSTDSSSSESESDDESEDDSEDSQSESSDSSSDSSSSDSSSDSESESEVAAPSRTKGKTPAQSTTTTPPAKSGPKPAATQSPVQHPVAPGQGMTKTQRRNVRRRIQQAAQRASKSVEGSQASAAQNTDLLAKKQALLQSLGVSVDASKHAHEPAASKKTATSLENHSQNLSESKDDPDAWRKKISYRAVECVNEGVALTEPPFPFVQRWDALQHGGKRKSRVDSQFYNNTDQNPKKRKLVQPSKKHADNCGVLDDVVLNYDDEPVGLDQGNADDNDLPALPADMSLLPQLSPDDGQPGLIIAWKQLLLTKATNWQPQLSNFMTAVITEADDGGGFRVQLAKRDRDVDKNKKEYDDEGGRVYAKFEVPDDDEEEEADLGYRDISFSEMIDPRVVRRPSDPTTETKISQPPERDVEVADSQRGRNDHTSNNTLSNSDQSRKIDCEQDGEGKNMDVDSTKEPPIGEQSFVPETYHDVVANGVDVGAQPDDTLAHDVSISEERRDEISQLINEGGFRQGVRTSLDQLTFLQFGSPSRQLEEEASSILPSRQLQSSRRSSSEAVSEEAPSEYGSKDPSQQEAHLADAVPVLDDFHSALQTPSQLGVNSDNEHMDGVASSHAYSKSGIEYPKLNNSFASQTSAHSGRQIDPDFVSHSDDLGHGDDSAMMNGFDDDDVPLNDGAHQTQTPTHEVYNDDLPQAKDVMAPLQPFKPTKTGPGGNDRPSSAGSASTGSSSIFVDFELLGSQPVTARFKEHIKGEPLSQAAQWMAGIPDINEAHSPAGSKYPVTGRNQSIDGTPVSQRSRHLTRSAQKSPQDTNDEETVSQRTRRSSRLMGSVSSSPVATKAGNAWKTRQHSNEGSPTPNGRTKSLVASFEAPVSPPALSKPRREPSRTPSRSQRG